MRIFKHVILFAVAIAAGLALGAMFRRNAQPVASANSTNITSVSAATNTAPTKPKKFHRYVKVDDSPLASALERDLSMSEGVTRWLYWLEAIEKAQLSDFPRLAQLAEGNSIARDLLAARWIDLSPRHMFDTIAAHYGSGDVWSSLGNTLFKEWPKRDVNAVIAALSEKNGNHAGGRMKDWRWQVAGALIESDPEVGVKLFHEWNIENYGPRMKGIGPWAAKDPRHAAEVALAHPAGYASRLIVEEIGKQWAQVNPTEGLNFAATRRDEYSSILAASTLKTWAEKDLDSAAQWLVSTDPSTRNRLSAPFVEAWGKHDPESALTWCEENLTGTTLAESVGGLVKGAAQNDVRAAADLVNSLKPSAARTEGALAVAIKWMPEYNARKPVEPEMQNWLAQLDTQSIRRVLDDVQWRWAENDPKGFADFLQQLKPDQITERTYSHLSRTFARTNPEQALDWASKLPDNSAITAGQEAFSTWFQAQPELSMQWLQSLSRTDTRRDPFFEATVRNMAYNHQGMERLALLPEEQRQAARQIIEKMPLGAEHREKVMAAFGSAR
jgi:hypothetical protein